MKSISIKSVLLLVLFCSSAGALASSLNTTISPDAIRVGYRMNFPGPLYGDVNYIHNYDNSDDLVNAGLYAALGTGVFGGRIGAKTFYSQVDKESGWGVAPGAGVYFRPLPKITLSADYFSAPSSMSNGDIKGYNDWSVKATFAPVRHIKLYAGYGDLEVETKQRGTVDYDQGMFYGVYAGFSF